MSTVWRDVANTFLNKWKLNDEVVGAMLTGSRVMGTSTPLSDIDVYIFLRADCEWEERGNLIVDSQFLEYFAYPISMIEKYIDMDFSDNQRTHSRMLSTGEIVFDKTDEIQKIQESSRTAMLKAFPKPDAYRIENDKYALWDSLDGLEELCRTKAINQSLVYYSHLTLVMTTYAVFIQTEIPHFSKIQKLHVDDDFRQKYNFPPFPDKVFTALFLEALAIDAENQLATAQRITEYVLEKMGDFSIDGWQLRSSTDIL